MVGKHEHIGESFQQRASIKLIRDIKNNHLRALELAKGRKQFEKYLFFRSLWHSFLGLLTYPTHSFIGKNLVLPACGWAGCEN